MKKRIVSLFSVFVLLIATLAITATMALAATALKITKQPAAASALNGKTAKASVSAVGDSLKYTWYYKDAKATKYTKDTKNTSKTYSVKMSSKVSGRTVYCVVKDKYGKSVKTKAVTLTMGKAAKITKQPAAVSALNGKTAKVTVKATGDGLKYTWYYKNAGASKYTKDTKNTGASYSVKMSSKVSGRSVYVVVKDKYGTSVKSKAVKLTLGKAAKITTQPAAVSALNGKTAKVTVKATGDGLKYTWYYKNAGASKYTKDTKNTGASYSVKMSSKVGGRSVYVVVKDKYGTSVKSKAVKLTLGKAAKITTQPAAVSALNGKTAKVTVKATGDGLKYIWYYKDAGASKYTKDTANTGASYSVKMSSKVGGRSVYVVVKDKYGTSVKSKAVKLTLGKAAKITTQPAGVSVLDGKTAKVTVKATGDGLTYTWYYKDAGASKYTKDTANTGASYSVKMSSKVGGRSVYVVVKDKYGTSVKSNAVKLTLGKAAKITTEPSAAKADCGKTAKVSVKATGDGLTYTWYYKDAGASKYTKDTANTGASYSVKMNNANNGRSVYVVVKDKYGTSVQSKTVTLTTNHVYNSGSVTKAATCTADGVKTYKCKSCSVTKTEAIAKTGHSYNSGEVTKAATCSADGVKLYTCKSCSATKTEAITKLGHKMGDWEVYLEATVTSTGTDRQKCTRSGCSYYKDRVSDKLPVKWNITVNNGVDASYKIGVAENGKYAITEPKKTGYNFAGWKTADGKDFAASGVNKSNVEINAVWVLDGTDTFAELKERTDAFVDEIKITADITVSEPIYICHNVKIYSDADYTIKRAPDYAGDIFVIGRTRDGKTAVDRKLKERITVDLGKGTGVLTLDGNRENVTVNVVGSMLFVADNSVVNMYDGVKIVNNVKLGNERINSHGESSYYKKAGGAAVIILDSEFNMYGGEISNNLVATEYTEEINPETQAVSNQEYNGCGGAIFNCGDFSMYGGVISGNEALRGGAIYSHRRIFLVSGTVSDNLAHVYGGAISSSSSANADTFIGSSTEGNMMTFKNNRSLRAGGVLYSNTNAPIIVEGKTEFINNRSETSGGVIYTAGPLLINDALFDGNSCPGSGGAIYHHYTAPDRERRLFEMTGSTLTNNSANLGGAVIFSASDAVAETGKGTDATIVDCSFSKNSATSNGGAIYITRKGDVTIEKCSFTENSAVTNAGAIAMHSQSNVIMTDSTVTGNTAALGGGMYISSGTAATLKNIELRNNSAKFTATGGGGNGGALYIYDSGVLNVDNVDFYNNTADNNAGALYLGVTELTIDKTCAFEGNSAGAHGGAMYMTYKTVKETGENGEEVQVKYGAKLNATNVTFNNNSAKSGGAISARTASDVNLTNCILTNNTASSDKTNEGGGAIYANNNTINLSGVQITGNSSAYYGGAVAASDADVTIKDNSTIENNSGKTGAALCLRGAGDYNLTDVGIANNGNGEGNGIVYATAGAKLNLTRVTASGNNSYNGGIAYASGASTVVTITDCIFTENTAKSNGGTVYSSNATVNVSGTQFSKNTAKNGGAFYSEGILNVSNTSITENSATSYGGAAILKGAAVTVSDTQISKNTANLGGAFYAEKGTLDLNNDTFTENSATSNGGAIDVVGTVADISENTTFTNNSAQGHGGAIYVNYIKKVAATETTPEVPAVYSNLVIDGGSFSNNTAVQAGAAVSVRTGSEVTFNGTVFETNTVTGTDGLTNGDGDGGGAIYVGFGTVNLNNVTATGNEVKESVYVNDKNEEKLYGFGGFINGYQGKIYIDGSTITGNKAPSGGAINLTGSNNVLSISKSSFTNNESTYLNADYDNTKGGGAINASNATITMTEATFDGNSTKWYGGAAILSKSVVTIDKSTFTNSKGATGAALNIKVNSDVTITDTEISNNTSSYNGVVYANNSTVTMNKVTATGNKALNGGVLYTSNGNTVIDMTDCDVTENTATSGGVAYTENATLKFNGCTISGNTATGNGGVVFSKAGTARIELNSCEISGNSAKSGGAVYTEPGASVSASNTVFTENKATSNGGAIYVKEAAEFTVDGSTFSKNYSKSNGGAIYVYRTPLALTDSAFTENSTDAHGGAINNIGSVITATGNNTFTSNTAKNHAGAIYLTYISAKDATETEPAVEAAVGVLNMTGGSFTGNSALGGGAFSVRTGCEATLTDTVLTGNTVEGYADKNDGDGEGGGAIYVGFGEVTLNNVTATGNEAKATVYVNEDGKEKLYSFGGVVDAYNADVTVVGGTYSGNKAAAGGVVYARSSDVNVSGAQFNNNESTYVNSDYDNSCGGGAIAIRGGTLNIDGATFDGNKSDYYGGAVHTLGTTVNVTNNSAFNNNVGGTGAAIYSSSSSKLTVDQSSFTANTSSFNGVIYVSGTLEMTKVTAADNNGTSGILNIGAGTASVSESNFSNNTVTNQAGAIYAKNCTLTLANNILSGNSAKNGGAVYLNLANVTLENSEFTLNTASANGGAIYLEAGTLTATGTNKFTSNSAASHGGAVYVVYDDVAASDGTTTREVATFNMTDGTFENNSANIGGAISSRTGCTVSLTSTVFEGNSATSETNSEGGGAIFTNDGTLTLSGVVMDGNASAAYGGAITALNAKLTIKDNSELKNTSGKTGTVFNFRGTGTYELTDVTVKDNGAGSGNGVIYITGSGTLNLTRVTVSGNNVYNGGAIYNSGSTVVNVVDSTISNNTVENGGAAIFYSSTGAFTVSGSTLSGNNAKLGGAIYHNSTGAFTITDSTVSGNTATDGGAVYQASTGTFTATGTTFSGNTATGNGGVVFSKAGTARTELDSCEISGNSAKSGGAVYTEPGASVSASNTVFTENKATSNGGAIYVKEAAEFTVDGSTFSKNYSKSNGGAIYVYRTPLALTDSAFTENSTDAHGGAINNAGSVITATGNNTFTSNTAKNHAGAIYLTYISAKDATETEPAVEAAVGVLNMTGGSFTGNSALGGGAFSVRTGCEATLTDTVLTGNTVEGYADKNDGDGEGGGVIYVGFGEVTLNNVTATDNEAKGTSYMVGETEMFYGFGGVVDSYHGTVNINGGTYENNKAPIGGVVNATSNDKVTISGALMKNNESTDENTAHTSTTGGGAIRIVKGELTVSGTTFDGNKTGYYGGAILASDTDVNISDNSVIRNSTGTTGGAIYLHGSSALVMENSELSDNTSTTGAIYSGGGAITMTNVTALNNTATTGGAVYTKGVNGMVVEGSTFSGNHATSNGGAIVLYGGSMTLKDSTFTGNSSDAHGGAISTSGGTITATGNNSFVGNTSKNHGGAIYVSYTSNDDGTKNPGILTMQGGTFENNTAVTAGGAISSRTSCEVSLTSTTLKGNSTAGTESNGGGGVIYSNDGTLTLSGVVMDGNASAAYGGAVTAVNANVTIKDNSEFKNTSGQTGTVFNFRGTGTYELTDVTVKDNGAGGGNGVIYITNTGTLNLTRVTVSGNNVYNGGAIYNSGSTVVNVVDSTISNNTVENGGAAIFYSSTGAFTVSGSTISDNNAKLGGAIYHNSTGAFTITDSTVSGNTATDGGAVYQASTGAFTATGTTFSGNTAKHSGGAIYVKGTGVVSTENCIFENNQATAAEEDTKLISRGGGAIYVGTGTTVNVKGGSFISNASIGTQDVITSGSEMTDAGGAVLVDGGYFSATGTAFTSNTANNGGAIGTSRSKTTKMDIDNCTFTSNFATKNGGGIYVQNGVKNEVDDIVITNCVFSKNVAETASGASAYIRTSSSAKFVNLTCSGGTYSYKGEVYATSGARLTLEGSVSAPRADDIVVTGASTTGIVNYRTDAEKTAWENVISAISSATVTYNQI